MGTNEASSIAVAFEPERDPDLRAVAASLTRALATLDEPEGEPAGAIALPAPEPTAGRLDAARVVIALDPRSAARARAAGAERVVHLAPRLTLDIDDALDVDLVLVAHEALADVARRRGLDVRVTGPVAPDEWTPAPDRAALKASLGPDPALPWVVVRAAALQDDPAATLVQLALVRERCVWLFDVGADPELARTLRRLVPGYALDALMFADGPDALSAYRAADAVLGELHGPEMIRALSVGAAPIAFPPRGRDALLAHALETAGVVEVADAAATLAVTLDGALEPNALDRARKAGERLGAQEGACRAVELVQKLARGALEPAEVSGLPRGLERLSHAERERPAAPVEPPKRANDLERTVDEELAALRKRLGL